MKYNIYNQFKIYFLFIFIIFSKSVLSNTMKEALDADEDNQYQEAAGIWAQLAKNGNAIAKYNLAAYYSSGKGVAKDAALEKKWLIEATHSGLAQAYTRLNKKALTSAKGQQLTFQSGPLYWLKEQNANLYTIQLASSRKEKSILNIYDENFLKGKGGYYRYQRDGVERYALIYGAYKTVAEANDAIKTLPKSLKKKTPWVRKIKSLQKISK